MLKKSQYQVKRKIIILFIALLLIIIGLSFRLIWIQVINSEVYKNKALEQRLRQLKVEPKRGMIYDNEGNKLAVSGSSQTVVAIPYEIENPESHARQLSQILKIDYETVYNRLTRTASAVYIKRKIEDEKVNKIRELNLEGITFTEESKRFYPKGSLASHILGFAGIDSQGLEGIENSFDEYLRGIPGKIEAERDASGRTIPGGIEKFVEPEDGYDIYLTINEVIQYIAERELKNALEEHEISGGSIIVMDPRDGALLALANYPDYNPNHFAEYPQKYWRNRAISDSYEPGSTFKIITTASALEQGTVSINDPFVCPGYIKVSGERIRCWEAGGHGSQNFTEVVKNSCNPGFVQVGMNLGKDNFYNYINSFGFGERSGLNLPGEATGILTDYDNIGPVELATLSFGHGISVTPIQLVTGASAVANKGVLNKPKLVDKIKTPEGELHKNIESVEKRQVVSEETSEITLNLLENVVNEGTGTNAGIEGYRIGGKTGTAKHYGQETYDSSFIGILPINDPQLVILVVLYDVESYPYYGSQTAAPVFRNVAYDTLRYLDIAPREPDEKEDEVKIEEVTLPDVREKNILEAENILRDQGLKVRIVGKKNNVKKQVPLPGVEVQKDSTIILFTEEKTPDDIEFLVTVPDLEGLTEDEARFLLDKLGLRIEAIGRGKIVEQDIEPGIRKESGTVIEVKLE